MLGKSVIDYGQFYPCNRDDSAKLEHNKAVLLFYPCDRDDSLINVIPTVIEKFYPCNRDDSTGYISNIESGKVLSL